MGVRPKGYCNLQKGSDFFVRFWGTRGSIPCPGESYTRYGGNTSCIEVRCGDKLLIFDAGTGLRPLGKQLCQNGAPEADIFLTQDRQSTPLHSSHKCDTSRPAHIR